MGIQNLIPDHRIVDSGQVNPDVNDCKIMIFSNIVRSQMFHTFTGSTWVESIHLSI